MGVKEGVEDVSEAAFRQHYGRVYAYLRRRTASHEEAEDLAQSVFAAAAEHLSHARLDRAPVLAWLYTVAERRLVDEARRRGRHPASVPLGEPETETTFGPDVASALRAALSALPGEQREVVVLRLLEGRPFAEVAGRVGVSEAACKMRFARALHTVRRALQEEGIEP